MRTAPPTQRGLAVLAFVLVLLFAMSLALLWTGRSLVFEHRAAANQQRQAVAFVAAESGLAWALARLNDLRAIDAHCRPSTAAIHGATFRDRYAAPWVAETVFDTAAAEAALKPRASARAGYAPPPGLRAMCRIGEAEVACTCDTSLPPNPAAHAGSPGFNVELVSVVGEVQALWLIARGCSADSADCDSTGSAQTEAQAVVRVKLRPVGDAGAAGLGEVLRRGPLAVVPGSWRDGRCAGSEAAPGTGAGPSVAAPAACGFAS